DGGSGLGDAEGRFGRLRVRTAELVVASFRPEGMLIRLGRQVGERRRAVAQGLRLRGDAARVRPVVARGARDVGKELCGGRSDQRRQRASTRGGFHGWILRYAEVRRARSAATIAGSRS